MHSVQQLTVRFARDRDIVSKYGALNNWVPSVEDFESLPLRDKRAIAYCLHVILISIIAEKNHLAS